MKKKIKTLEDIWGKLKPGDIVLKQTSSGKGKYEKTELVIIIGIDVWDMAMAVYYTDYKSFNPFSDKEPKIEGFGEWMQYWNVLGHWKTMPTFKQLLKAKRKEKPFEIVETLKLKQNKDEKEI